MDDSVSDLETERSRVEAAVARVPGWSGRSLVAEPAIPILASPSWRGVDGTPWRVRDLFGGESLLVKAMHNDARFYIDVPCAFEAASRASDLGIGPKVFLADSSTGVLVMEELAEGWRVGTLDRLLEPAICDRVLAARKAFQATPPLPRTAGVFEEVERFLAAAQAAGAAFPSYIDWLVDNVRAAGEVLGKTPAAAGRPIHGDGNVSNVLINDAGEIRLIDWDRATTADPLEDIGSFLVEAHAGEPEARDTFTRYFGDFDEQLFNRARLYGIADDLRWGLIGSLLAARSRRVTLEFYKFASWRYLRCRMAIREPRFAERLRRVQ